METRPNPAGSKKHFGSAALVGVALLSAGLATGTVLLLLRHDHPASEAPKEQPKKTLYTCPMHPSIIKDAPGDCPICGMKLVPLSTGVEGNANEERKILFYRSPMDPKQTSPTPRKDEMGMDYLPVYDDEAAGESKVSGLAAIDIDPARQQLIGLTTVEVSEGPVGGAWRTLGRVAVDETRVRHINMKVGGFVEHIVVDFVGKKVRKGDPLFSVYSPDLLAAQEEYLLALKTQKALSNAGNTVASDGDALVAAARRKLALWDIPESDLDRIAKTGEPTKTLTFYSPVEGVVTKKDVVQGMKLDPGAMPYEIVDLSSVWVLADVYESELRHVKEGMAATLRLNAFPDREFKGKVAFINPMLDPQTRTVKVRLAFSNPTGEVRPEMFGEVILLGEPHVGLRVPLDAVIDSGTRKIVFAMVGDGKFQPRVVRLGDSDGTHAEVRSGLSVGERVVTRANFLIDSESRLRASLQEMTDKGGADSARVLPEPSAHPHGRPAADASVP